MANSNENTQNPKGNQEKMADKGIQEHSEHTAENKQPESKDNAQKKDESTCLCKFFKKIAEWVCARKNKNSNNADENATKNNDAAKQAEIKQADTVEQSKEQRKLSDHLETISIIIGISTVIGILFGGYVIYVYLLKINQLSILPDVISNPSSLIASIAIFIIIFIIVFLLNYLLAYLFLPEFFSLKQYFCNQKSLKSNHPNKSDNDIWLVRLLPIIFYIAISIALFLFLKIFLEYLFPQKNTYLLLLILIIIIIVIICFTYNYPIDNLNLKDKSAVKSLIKGFMVYIVTILCIMIFASDKTQILYFTHSIETPKNSSWYLLHNNFQQNNGSQETNGIDKNDLIKLKQNFKCSILSEEEKARKGIVKCSSIPEQRNNALYGYMAWNLGDTKVFCPPTIDNRKADSTETEDENSKTKNEDSKTEGQKEADKLAEECIVISGKALQIMPESYISTNTDGIDDSNPDNTGHDDPAIDINTDVKFKNDLNAQSNAGLNNFNVQPILPIQSNAKNMSIQIHYGSCNHDSPRNKDGHPDIGYTDKKICQ